MIARTAVLFAVLLPTSARADDASTNAVRRQLDDWAAAYVDGDAAKMIGFYEDSPKVHLVLSSGTEFNGAKAIKSMYVEAVEEVRFVESKLEDLVVRQQGDVAWARARHRARFVTNADGSRYKLAVRTTFVLVRTDDGWRIASEHSSVLAETPRLQPDEE